MFKKSPFQSFLNNNFKKINYINFKMIHFQFLNRPGTTTISELEMERTLEELEKQSWDKINVALKNNEAQEEQDDSVICDVCRSVSL